MKKFYLLSLFLLGMGLMTTPAFASASGSAAVRAAEDEVTTISVDPAPGHYDEGLPSTVTVTFSSAISELESVFFRAGYGRGGEMEEDWYSLNEEKTVLTINIPAESVLGVDLMVISIDAKDANGNLAQYEGSDIVQLIYTTTLPANTYECLVETPLEGVPMGQLSTFELSFSNEADPWDFIGGLDESKKIVLKDAEGSVVATATNLEVKGWSGVLTFTLDNAIDKPGEYTLELPEGMVYNSMYDEYADDFGVEWGALYNPATYFVFTVSPVKVDKLSGDYEDGLPETVTLTFPQDIASVESVFLRTQYSNDRFGTDLLDLEGVCVVEGNTVTLNIPSELLVGNEFAEIVLEVTDTDGMSYSYETSGLRIRLLYTTDLPDDRFACVATPSPDEVQEELSVVELAFVNPADADDFIGNDLPVQSVKVYDENGVEITTANLSIKPNGDFPYSNVVVATFVRAIRGIGTYSFSIPEKLVYNSLYDDFQDDFGVSNGAIYNAAATFEFTIAEPNGIEGVETAGKQAVIYNVAGQKLRETDLSKLGRGVYIVNGKKVLVK